MSVRVIIKDVKKRTKACDECKRRKGRCDGGMPCEWCSARNLECVFSALSHKRGPKKKKRNPESDNEQEEEILTLDKREQGMTHDLELNNYLSMFMKYLDPLFTMFTQWDKGNRVIQLNNPRSYSQFITKYAACAIAARSIGHKERSTQLIHEARSFAGQCFDDMSVDGLIGFMLIGAYWAGIDMKLSKHYMNIAMSIFSTMSPNSVPPNIRYIMAASAVMLNNAISDTDKVKVYLATQKTIVAQSNVQALLGSVMRLCFKTFSHMRCPDYGTLRSDIAAVLVSQVFFSEKQRQSILEELQQCRNIANVCTDIEASRIMVNLVFNTLEVFVEWRSGHPENALPLAIEVADQVTSDVISFGSAFDVSHFLLISIFLREQQHLALADKVRKTAESLHMKVCDTLPELATSADPIALYLRRRPIAQQQHAFLVLSPPPSPPSNAVQEQYNAIDDTMVPAMVSNVISLVSQLLPSNNPNALLSAQGLHLFYNTLSSILPPTPSPYETEDIPSPPQMDHTPTRSPTPSIQQTFKPTQSFSYVPTSQPGHPSPQSPSPNDSPVSLPSPPPSSPPITPPNTTTTTTTTSTTCEAPMEQIFTPSQQYLNKPQQQHDSEIISFRRIASSLPPSMMWNVDDNSNNTSNNNKPETGSTPREQPYYQQPTHPNSFTQQVLQAQQTPPHFASYSTPNPTVNQQSGINDVFNAFNNIVINGMHSNWASPIHTSSNLINTPTAGIISQPIFIPPSSPQTVSKLSTGISIPFTNGSTPNGEWDWMDDWQKLVNH